MKWFSIEQTLIQKDIKPENVSCVLLVNSDELTHLRAAKEFDKRIIHTPLAKDAKVCKAEVRSDCLSGTLLMPYRGKNGERLACAYLITENCVVLVDDDGDLSVHLKHMIREKQRTNGSIGRFLYNLFENLIAKDLHRLEEIEDNMQALEDKVLAGVLDDFNAPMTVLRKEAMTWLRYYSQLDDVASEFRENENGFFSDEEGRLFRMLEDRINRLRERSQQLCDYSMQIQSMFQAEVDIRQNRIMQILTIVTAIFLPLTLLVGWYGMNFAFMPELKWRYGYPVLFVVSIIIVIVSLYICKKKKFW